MAMGKNSPLGMLRLVTGRETVFLGTYIYVSMDRE